MRQAPRKEGDIHQRELPTKAEPSPSSLSLNQESRGSAGACIQISTSVHTKPMVLSTSNKSASVTLPLSLTPSGTALNEQSNEGREYGVEEVDSTEICSRDQAAWAVMEGNQQVSWQEER